MLLSACCDTIVTDVAYTKTILRNKGVDEQ